MGRGSNLMIVNGFSIIFLVKSDDGGGSRLMKAEVSLNLLIIYMQCNQIHLLSK